MTPYRKATCRMILVGVASLLVSGCIFFPSAKDRALRRSPAFQQGYSDGCAAAAASGSNYREGPYRDEARYKSDTTYRAGWSNGFQTCRTDRTGAGAPPGLNPIPSPQ